MFKLSLKLVWTIALVVLFSASAAWAQTTTASTTDGIDNTQVASSSTVSSTIADDQLEGVEVEEVTKMPTRWGLWWKSVKETISVAITFDPVKKAEKRLKFAEERMKYAEYIANNAKNPKKQAWAEKMVSKANKFMTKIEENKNKWLNNPNARKRHLLKNVAIHQIRKEKILDKLEDKLPQDKLDALQKLRVNSIERSQRLIKAIANTNIATSTRRVLQATKIRVEKHLKDIRKFQQKRKTILEKIKNGDTEDKEELKKELEELRYDRKDKIEANRKRYQKVKANLRQQAKEGDETAKKKLKVINKVQNRVKKVIPKHKLNPGIKKVLPSVKRIPSKIAPAVKARIRAKKQAAQLATSTNN